MPATINHILRAMPEAEAAIVAPFLMTELGVSGRCVLDQDADANVIFFPDEALLSVQCSWGKGSPIELALVCADGAAGATAMLCAAPSPYKLTVARPGAYRTLRHPDLVRLLDTTPYLRQAILRQHFLQMARFAEAAAIQASGCVTERLALRLDERFVRMNSRELSITHLELASLLGVRRAGVTLALQVLEGHKAIRSRRGKIRLIDRDVLLAQSRIPRRTTSIALAAL